MYAAFNGYLKCVKILLKFCSGEDYLLRQDSSGLTALQHASNCLLTLENNNSAVSGMKLRRARLLNMQKVVTELYNFAKRFPSKEK